MTPPPEIFGLLGVPATFTGFLVPIREAGVLLPQLIVAAGWAILLMLAVFSFFLFPGTAGTAHQGAINLARFLLYIFQVSL